MATYPNDQKRLIPGVKKALGLDLSLGGDGNSGRKMNIVMCSIGKRLVEEKTT
jgi:hypothetical protein